jgi:hypothetical protein
MRNHLPFDDALALRLPLPLAQLYRRAHNASSGQDRHHAAYYLWEAALKLLGSAAVACYLDSGRTPDANLAALLGKLTKPQIGNWWNIARSLTTEMADCDPGLATLRDLLPGKAGGKARKDLPQVAALDAALQAQSAGKPTVRLSELFDRMVEYRNQEFGHGAVGQRSPEHYDRMGERLLVGLLELLGQLDVLAGRRLFFLREVVRQPSGAWLVERYELMAANGFTTSPGRTMRSPPPLSRMISALCASPNVGNLLPRT